MQKKIRVLLIGESWFIRTMEVKGFDSFTADSYGTGIEYIQKALDTEDIQFHHMPCHMVGTDFPGSLEELQDRYDVLIISDVGANTFLLPVETFLQSKKTPNKLEMIKEFVLHGGALCMVGGYLSFMGIEGKGKYYQSPVEEVLPVNFLCHDDRQEHPEGIDIRVKHEKHPVISGISPLITGILGYNRATAKPEADVLLSYEGDPILALGSFGQGRSAAYATDCAPHWSSPEFSDSEDYRTLWRNLIRWLAKRENQG
ncbi:MAG: glutamine amidotransferase [Eubacteriales bacterium]|nr:glutamine amidotransferase [Eubacteriales bacterium]